MVRLTLAAVLSLIAARGETGELRCSFTEPFFNLTFDSATGKVIELWADVTDPDTGQPIPQVITESGARLIAGDPSDSTSFRLVKGEETILDLKLTGNGSNGMSDTLYPFQAWRGRFDGGCETAKYPAFDVYDLVEDLGIKH